MLYPTVKLMDEFGRAEYECHTVGMDVVCCDACAEHPQVIYSVTAIRFDDGGVHPILMSSCNHRKVLKFYLECKRKVDMQRHLEEREVLQ